MRHHRDCSSLPEPTMTTALTRFPTVLTVIFLTRFRLRSVSCGTDQLRFSSARSSGEREREGATVSRWKRQASVATEVMARREARLLGANFGCLARLSGENEVPRQLEMLLLRDPPPLKFCWGVSTKCQSFWIMNCKYKTCHIHEVWKGRCLMHASDIYHSYVEVSMSLGLLGETIPLTLHVLI